MSLIQWTQKCRFIVFCNKCILLTLSITPSHPLYSSWAISQTLHSVSACLQYYWNSKLSHCACSVKLRHVPPAVCHFSFWGHAGQRQSYCSLIEHVTPKQKQLTTALAPWPLSAVTDHPSLQDIKHTYWIWELKYFIICKNCSNTVLIKKKVPWGFIKSHCFYTNT